MAVKQCEHCGKPVIIPDAPALPRNLTDVCQSFPELCAGVRTIKNQLNVMAQNMADLPKKNEHISPSQDVIKDWLDCPECKPKYEALLKEYPELFKPGEEAEEESEVPFYAQPNFGRK